MHFLTINNKFYSLLGRGYFSFLFAFLTVIILPIHVSYLPPFMIFWCISWIFESFILSERIRNSKKEYRFLFYLFVIFYLWKVVGLIYSSDVKMGLLNLFGRLSLLLFPLVLILPGEMIKNKVSFLIRTFAAGTFFYILFCFGYALFRSLNYQDGILIFNAHPDEYPWMSYFYGTYLTISRHPSYISMYVLLSVFICFESWLDYSYKLLQRIFWLFVGFFLLISQYFLSSRAGILICLILIPSYFIYKFRKHRNRKFVWIGIIVIAILLLPVIVKNKRVDYLYGRVFNKQVGYERKKDPRFQIWESTLKVAHKNLLFGVGIGDARTELTHEYERIGEKEMAKEKLNAHNQFLEVLLENGIIGLVIFCSIFICMFYIAISDKNLLYGLFILMVFMFFLFETVLYRLAGVTFFSLFSFLLIYNNINKQTRHVDIQKTKE
jgi:O-antigen ligase